MGNNLTGKSSDGETSRVAGAGEQVGMVALDAKAGVLARLRRLRGRAERIARERSRLENEVKAALGEAEVGTVAGRPAAIWKSTLRIFVSQKLVKERHPQIARECTDITEVRTFKVVDD